LHQIDATFFYALFNRVSEQKYPQNSKVDFIDENSLFRPFQWMWTPENKNIVKKAGRIEIHLLFMIMIYSLIKGTKLGWFFGNVFVTSKVVDISSLLLGNFLNCGIKPDATPK